MFFGGEMITVSLELSLNGDSDPTIISKESEVEINNCLPMNLSVKDLGQMERAEGLAAAILFEEGASTTSGCLVVRHPYWFPNSDLKKIVIIKFQGICASLTLHSAFLRGWMGPKQTNYSHPSVFVSEIYNETLTTHSPCQTNLTYPIGEGWNARFDKERGIQLLQGETLMMEVSLVYVGCGNISIELFPD